MPTSSELIARCVVSVMMSLIMIGVLHLLGLGEHSALAAAVSASTSAAISMSLLSRCRSPDG